MLALNRVRVNTALHATSGRGCGSGRRDYRGLVQTAGATPSGATDAQQALTAVAALSDTLQRRMYEFIRSARRPVGREEAAATVGISRKHAAFHLDTLVEVGLLRAGSAPNAHSPWPPQCSPRLVSNPTGRPPAACACATARSNPSPGKPPSWCAPSTTPSSQGFSRPFRR